MADPIPPPPPPLSPTTSQPAPSADPPLSFDIGEEFGTAKKNLPPIKVVLIAVGAVVVVIAIAAFFLRSRSSASGTIDQIVPVQVPNQNSIMVAINLSVKNNGSKPYKITQITSDLESQDKTLNDTAASKIDLERYYQVLPALKQPGMDPISVEDVIQPDTEVRGTIVVSFEVSMDEFSKRKGLTVSIFGKDEYVPLVIKK